MLEAFVSPEATFAGRVQVGFDDLGRRRWGPGGGRVEALGLGID